MARPQAVFIAGIAALCALFALSLLMAARVEAAPRSTGGAPGLVGQAPAASMLHAPEPANPLSLDTLPAAAAPLTCTYVVTTPASDVTNNFSFATAAALSPYNNLSLLPPDTPPPITITLPTQYFQVDAVQGFHYLVSAVPNSLSTYNLSIVVYNSSQTPVLTSTKPLNSLSASVDFLAPSSGTYFFAVSHIASNCPSGTYKLTADGPATATPTPTGTATPTGTPTGSATPGPTALAGADRFEPDFDFDRAGLVALNVKYTNLNFVPWAGADPYARDDDFYKVWVKPGMLVTCETLDLAAGVDTNMIMFDNNRNGLGGNDDIDRANGNFGSRVTYYVTYEGYLYLDVGQPFALDPRDAAGFTYSLQCATGSGPTSTPTPTRIPITPSPTIPTNTPTPTTAPTDTPTSTSTPPFIQVHQLPTATPAGPGAVLVPISLQVYYDANNNHVPDPGEGVIGVSARVVDVNTGQELQHAFTDEFGFASLAVNATGVVRLIVPYLNYSVVIQPSGSSIALRIAPHDLPSSIP
jgi:hypothetical protein